MTKTEEDYFLSKLTELSRETSITIGGCGCCGSPGLEDHEDTDTEGGHYIYDNQVEWKPGTELPVPPSSTPREPPNYDNRYDVKTVTIGDRSPGGKK